jgi:metallo-beta-lactamase family protein
VISASGMCEGGRILHHLRGTIQDKKNTVLIVGFQAKNTLGRKLVEGLPEVKIFGALLSLKAEVVVLNGFSGHADQQGLLNFAESVRRQGRLERIMLVHGEIHAQEIFKDLLNSHNFKSVEIPEPGDRMTI